MAGTSAPHITHPGGAAEEFFFRNADPVSQFNVFSVDNLNIESAFIDVSVPSMVKHLRLDSSVDFSTVKTNLLEL